MRRDLVCLQVGTAANYVGAHVWNLQDEYLAIPPSERDLSPSTFFRAVAPGSIAAKRGLLYAPRVQVVDATGAFGALSTHDGKVLSSADAAAARTAPLPSPRATRYVHPPMRQSNYVRSLLEEEEGGGEGVDVVPDEDVRFWSDYLKTRLHPRSCMPLPGIHHGVAQLDLFDKGVELARPAQLEELYDELRYFVEECDEFGGVCVIAGADDAWAGFAAAYLSHLYEELGNACPMLLFGVHDAHRTYSKQGASSMGVAYEPRFEMTCSRNEARFVSSCIEYSTQYIPLSAYQAFQVPFVHTKPQNLFHSSALLGLSLNTALAPLQERLSLAGLIGAIRPNPFACVGSLGSNLPPSSAKVTFGRSLFETEGSTNFSCMPKDSDRGRLKRVSQSTLRSLSASRCTEIVSARGLGYSVWAFSNVSCPVTIPIPFPNILDSALEKNKSMAVDPANASKQDGDTSVEQVGIMASIGTVAADGYNTLTSLGNDVNPIKKARDAHSSSTQDDDLREVSEALLNRAADYTTL